MRMIFLALSLEKLAPVTSFQAKMCTHWIMIMMYLHLIMMMLLTATLLDLYIDTGRCRE